MHHKGKINYNTMLFKKQPTKKTTKIISKLTYVFVLACFITVSTFQPAASISPRENQTLNLGAPLYYDDSDPSDICFRDDLGGGEQTEAIGVEAFTERYGEIAFELGQEHGIPYEVILAQAAHESAWGGSGLTEDAYNFFGIKPGASWDGPVVTRMTTEFIDGQQVEIEDEFRAYKNAYAGFLGYVDLIYNAGGGSRYEEALNYPNDAHQFIIEVANAGYATDPQYAQKVTNTINNFKDYIAENDLFPPSSEITSNSNPPPDGSSLGRGFCASIPTGEFIHYRQCDDEWADYPLLREHISGVDNSYMCRGGCGPAAVAMVLANMYDPNITPVDVADYSNENQYHVEEGSRHALMENGPEDLSNGALQVINHEGSLESATNTLNEGGLVIATGKDSPPPYTSGGHIIVIRAELDNGNFLVGDSANHNPLDHEYSRDEIDNGRRFWGVVQR